MADYPTDLKTAAILAGFDPGVPPHEQPHIDALKAVVDGGPFGTKVDDLGGVAGPFAVKAKQDRDPVRRAQAIAEQYRDPGASPKSDNVQPIRPAPVLDLDHLIELRMFSVEAAIEVINKGVLGPDPSGVVPLARDIENYLKNG